MTMTATPLTSADVELFYKQGFVRVNQVFTPQEMDEIDQAFERLYAAAEKVATSDAREADSAMYNDSRFTFSKGNNWVRHIAFCGNAEPALLRYGRDPRLLAIASSILASKQLDHLINQAHYKRPGSAVVFDWHQDIVHRGIKSGGFKDVNGKGSYVQIALAIDDATPDNGPLEFIAESNQHGIYGDDLASKVDMTKRVAPLLKRGDVVAFGPYTVHGSEANTSDKSRRVFINGFAYPGANLRTFPYPKAGDRLTFDQGR